MESQGFKTPKFWIQSRGFVIFNRIAAKNNRKPAGQLRVKFVNHDIIRGTLISLDSEELVFKTRFDQFYEQS